MSELSYDDVRKILAIIENSTVDELHVELGDFKLDVRRHSAAPATVAPGALPGNAMPPSAGAAAAPAVAPPSAAPRQGATLGAGQFVLAAPMLGTFYRAPAPDAPPFVEVGAQVAAGDPLCIIEVMKLMNTIAAERAGRVCEIAAANGTMVEFGQTLIVFDPL